MVMFTPGVLDGDPRLSHALGRVRSRYRLRVLFRGVAVIGAGALLGTTLSGYALDALRYSRGSVAVVTTLFYLWILLLAARYAVLPLWRIRKQASDASIARYIEEHDPSLDAALRSAVDVLSHRGGPQESTAFHSRLIDDVVHRLEAFDLPREVERGEMRMAAIALGAAAISMVVFYFFAPAFVQQAFPYLFNPFARSGRPATPYSVDVTPGHATIARGSDQEVAATLRGFDETAEVVSRQSGADWSRSPMVRDLGAEGAVQRFMLLSVQADTEYFIESARARSEVFRLAVVDQPYVKNIDLEFRLPAYTRLPPQKVEGTGDITTLKGAEVVFSITPTVAVASARIVVQGAESNPISLEVAQGGLALSGRMRIAENGFYKVELQGPQGPYVAASPDYVIEVIPDLPPRVAFKRPGRDSQATPIEEVFTEATAEDDFGVAAMELVYSVNGGEEKVVPLHQKPALKEVAAGHTFFLEEFGLKPGDFISYFARATDGGVPAQQATTDIYFLEARPYRRDFRQAEQAGGGGGGEGGDDAGSLSQQQRQVIAATFRLAREQESRSRDAKSLAQDAQTVALIQQRLRTQVEGLLTRMLSRGALPDGSPMHGTADELRQAITKMGEAETELKVPRPRAALPVEQKALAHIQRAEASFREVQVAMGGGGGGGGGRSNSSADELADLYELDLDKLRNQYETLQSGAREQREEQVDEALSRLQELARRQEQENERARQRGARAPNQGGGGGSASQRQLADEAEELGRRLERLTRENPSPGLEESARRLREAASAMRQQASGSRGQAPGAPAGQSPLDRLREARRLLDQERSTRLDRDLAGFKEKAEALKRDQEQIARDLREIAAGQGARGSGAQAMGSSRPDRVRERKDALASELAALESQLDKVAREARREQKEASRKLQEAANGIRDSKLKEKIRYTKGLVERAGDGTAEAFEEDIAQSLEHLAGQLREAGQSMGTSPEKKRADALDRARELARGLDSMQERLRARGTSSASEEPGGKDAAQPGSQSGSQTEGPGETGQGTSRGQEGEGGGSPGGGGRAGLGGSSANGGRPGGRGGGRERLTAEEQRQLRREITERARDAEAFERALHQSGVSSPQAAAMVRRLQGLATDRNLRDPLGLAELASQVASDLKMLEYVLRRESDGKRPDLQLSGSEELPPGYRAMVEEYYRTLARKPGTSSRPPQ